MTATQQLTQRLHNPDYDAPSLKSLLQKIYSRHHDLIDRYEISISYMTTNLLIFSTYFFLSPVTANTFN